MTHHPLILITNDDGIASKGLRSAAEACDPLGEVLICAPTVQQSGTGRSMPPTSEGRIFPQDMVINGRAITGYAVEGTPAQVVQHGMFEIAERAVDLVVSGINYGENLGEGVRCRAPSARRMESGSFGVPSIAISLETDPRASSAAWRSRSIFQRRRIFCVSSRSACWSKACRPRRAC